MNNKRFDIVSKYKIWFLVPAVLVLITLIMYGVFAGVNKNPALGIAIGIEFQGGTQLDVEVGPDKINDANISKEIRNIIGKNGGQYNFEQKSGGKSLVFKYSVARNISEAERNKINSNIKSEIENKFADIKAVNPNFVSATVMGASASNKLITTAIISIIISTLLILLYILVRFELFSAIAAVTTLSLDVFTMFCMMIIFHIQINSTFIAAIITIVAYSINNTIVIFDRVRENYKLLDVNKYDDRFIVNKSVRDTMIRSVATTATTLFSIVLFAILGVSSIKEFALPVIFGLFSGLFTSVCVAPSLFVLMKEKDIKRRGKSALGFKTKK